MRRVMWLVLLTHLLALPSLSAEVSKEQDSEILPVEYFFKDSDLGSSKISPSGKYLATIIERNGQSNLAILDVKTKKPHALFHAGESRGIALVNWVNDERFVYMTTYKMGSFARPFLTGEIYAGNFDGSKRKRIYEGGRFTSILSNYEKDPNHIIVTQSGNYPIAYRLNVYTGRKQKIARAPMKQAQMGVDNDGDVRIALGQTTSLVTEVYYREGKNSKWKKIDSRPESEGGLRPIGFTKDNKKVYMKLEADDDSNGYYLYDPSNQKLELLAKADPKLSVTGLIWDNYSRGHELIGYEVEPDKVKAIFFDENHPKARLFRSLEASFPEQSINIGSVTKDYKTALLYVYSDKKPGEFYLFDLEKKRVEYAYSISSWVKDNKLVNVKPIHYKTRDGLTIHGYLTLPKGKEKNLPMVLKVHGGPYGPRDSWGFDPEDQFLANRGYAVLKVNYRGSGGYGNAFQYDNYKKMGAEMQDDLTDATLWAIKQGIADKNRICIYGGSYGGYASLMGVVKEPDLYKCAIPYVGAYDIKLQSEEADYAQTEWGKTFRKNAWGYGDEKFMKERSPITHLSNLKAALFFVHGGKDVRCPIENLEAVREKLDKMNYPYEVLIKEKEGHGFYEEESKFELYSKMEKFLAKHIGDENQRKLAKIQ